MAVTVCFCIAEINVIIELEAEVIQIETRRIVFFIDKVSRIIQSLTHLQYLILIASQSFPKRIYYGWNLVEILTLSIVHGQCVVITGNQRTEITHNTGCWNLAFFQFRFVKWTAARLLCSKTYRWEDVYLVISWNAKIERLVASYRIVEINLHQVSPVLFCNLVSWVVQQIIEVFYSLWQLDFLQLRITCLKQTQSFRRCCRCRTMCQIHHHNTLDILVNDFIWWKSVFHLIAITRTLHEYGCKHRTVWIIFQKFCYLWPGHILARHLVQLLLNHLRVRRLEISHHWRIFHHRHRICLNCS